MTPELEPSATTDIDLTSNDKYLACKRKLLGSEAASKPTGGKAPRKQLGSKAARESTGGKAPRKQLVNHGDLDTPMPTFADGYHLSFYMAGEAATSENIYEGLIIGIRHQTVLKGCYYVYVGVYYGKSRGSVVTLNSNEHWQFVQYKAKVEDSWVQNVHLSECSFTESTAEEISAILHHLSKADCGKALVSNIITAIEQDTPNRFKCLLQDPKQLQISASPKGLAKVVFEEVPESSPLTSAVSKSTDGQANASGTASTESGVHEFEEKCLQLSSKHGRGKGPTTATGKGKGRPTGFWGIEHPEVMSQELGSVDCGPMMIQNLRNFLFAWDQSEMLAQEARYRQTLAILHHDVNYLHPETKLTPEQIQEVSSAWAVSKKGPIKLGSSVTWAALHSLQDATMVWEECIDALCQLLQPQANRFGTLIMSVALLNQVRSDEQEEDTRYTRSSKFLVAGAQKALLIPIQEAKHYFSVMVDIDQIGLPTSPLRVFDSAAEPDLIRDRPAFQSLWRFLQNNFNRNQLHASLVKEQSHAIHINSYNIPQFFRDRVGSPILENAGNASSFSVPELTSTLKSASKYSSMRKSAGISGDLSRAMLVDILSSSVNKTMLESIRIRLSMIDGADTDIGETELLQEYTKHMGPGVFPKQFGGDFELFYLSKVLESPIIVFQYETDLSDLDSRSNFEIQFVHGLDQPGLPVCLALLNPQSRYCCHYILLVPSKIPEFAKRLEAAEHLVLVHPPRVTVFVGTQLVQMAMFGSPGDGDCLFTTNSLAILSHQERYQRGGLEFKSLIRLKDLGIEELAALKIFNSRGRNKGTPRQLRKLVDTPAGGHAYGESSLTAVIKMALIARDFLVGPYLPYSVTADLGVGMGAIVLVQHIVAGVGSVAIGTEIDESIHSQFVMLQEELLAQGWSGRVATRNIDALHVGSLDGVHAIHLFEGHGAKTDDLRHPDKVALEHATLIGNCFSTPSVEIVCSTKATERNFACYMKFNDVCAVFGNQFFPVLCSNAPTTGSKLITTMWVRKPEYRLPREAASSNTQSSKELIPQLIASARAADFAPDRYGRHQRIKFNGSKHCQLRSTTHNAGKACCLVLGAELTIPLKGFTFIAGTQVQLKGSTKWYIYAGVSTKPLPSSLEMDELILYRVTKTFCAASIWVVPVAQVEKTFPPSTDFPTPWRTIEDVASDLHTKRFPFLTWDGVSFELANELANEPNTRVSGPSLRPRSSPTSLASATPSQLDSDETASVRRSIRAQKLKQENLQLTLTKQKVEVGKVQAQIAKKKVDLEDLRKDGRNLA